VAGGNVTLDASGSGAACNHSVSSYQWTSSDPANHPVGSSNSPTTSVAAPSSGSFTVTLTVTDDGGRTDTASVTVTSTSASTTAPANASASNCLTPMTVVSLTPHGPSVLAGTGTQAFTASVGDASNTAVTWQVNGIAGGNTTYGTISAAGLYSAPAVIPNPATVMVTALSVADTTRSAWTQLTITSPTVSVSVSPATASVVIGATQSFSATVTGTSNNTVNWQVNGVAGGNATFGTISSSGVYTAPTTVPSPANIAITAVSAADPAVTGTAQVTVTAPSNPLSQGATHGGGGGGSGALDPTTLAVSLLCLLATLRRQHGGRGV
jgi:hypothetical protein